MQTLKFRVVSVGIIVNHISKGTYMPIRHWDIYLLAREKDWNFTNVLSSTSTFQVTRFKSKVQILSSPSPKSTAKPYIILNLQPFMIQEDESSEQDLCDHIYLLAFLFQTNPILALCMLLRTEFSALYMTHTPPLSFTSTTATPPLMCLIVQFLSHFSFCGAHMVEGEN